MKVKELREWLADFGEKQKLHRARNESSPSLTSTDKVQRFGAIQQNPSSAETSPTSSRDAFSPRTQIESIRVGYSPVSLANDPVKAPAARRPATSQRFGSRSKSFDDRDNEFLALKIDPSTDPTVFTRDESTAAISQILQPIASWDAGFVQGGSWDSVDFTDPEPNFDYSPTSSFHGSTSDSVRGASLRPDDSFLHKRTTDGTGGLRGLGKVHLALLKKQQSQIMADADHKDEIEVSNHDTSTKEQKSTNMHSANIFGNRTLTASTLDFICNQGEVKCRYSRDCLAEDDTSSSLSNDSTARPSIVPEALDCKMARLLLDPHPMNESVQRGARYQRAPRTIPRCKKIDPKDLEFLTSDGNPPSLGKSQNVCSKVSGGIHKFGGPKKTIVERRKEELEKLWSEQKATVHVKKVKWGVCQRTGMYKKRIVVDVQNN